MTPSEARLKLEAHLKALQAVEDHDRVCVPCNPPSWSNLLINRCAEGTRLRANLLANPAPDLLAEWEADRARLLDCGSQDNLCALLVSSKDPDPVPCVRHLRGALRTVLAENADRIDWVRAEKEGNRARREGRPCDPPSEERFKEAWERGWRIANVYEKYSQLRAECDAHEAGHRAASEGYPCDPSASIAWRTGWNRQAKAMDLDNENTRLREENVRLSRLLAGQGDTKNEEVF